MRKLERRGGLEPAPFPHDEDLIEAQRAGAGESKSAVDFLLHFRDLRSAFERLLLPLMRNSFGKQRTEVDRAHEPIPFQHRLEKDRLPAVVSEKSIGEGADRRL